MKIRNKSQRLFTTEQPWLCQQSDWERDRGREKERDHIQQASKGGRGRYRGERPSETSTGGVNSSFSSVMALVLLHGYAARSWAHFHHGHSRVWLSWMNVTCALNVCACLCATTTWLLYTYTLKTIFFFYLQPDQPTCSTCTCIDTYADQFDWMFMWMWQHMCNWCKWILHQFRKDVWYTMTQYA